MNAFVLVVLLAQTRTLTVHETVDRALRIHPTVALAEASAERGDFVAREAESTRRPQLSLETSVNRFQEPMVVAPLHGFDPQRPPVFDETLAQGSLNVAYTLFDASRGGRISRARSLAAAAEVQAEGARSLVIAEAVRAFLRVRSTREVAMAQEKQVAALQRERDRAAQLVEQGKAARVVLLRAEAALSTARADAIGAVSDREAAEQELARFIGAGVPDVEQSRLIAARARDTAYAREELLTVAERLNPDLRRLRLQSDAADAERSAARGSWWPRVQLGGRYVEYASSATSPQGEWQGGAQLSYPVYTGGARGAAVDRASAETRIASAEVDLGKRRIAEAIDRALTAFRAASARVRALVAAVAQSEEVTRIDLLALEAGAGVQTDYLTAEANLFRVRAALTDARASEVMAHVELARITGELTTEWLAAHVENVQ